MSFQLLKLYFTKQPFSTVNVGVDIIGFELMKMNNAIDINKFRLMTIKQYKV